METRRILTNNNALIENLRTLNPEYLAYATGESFLKHLLTDSISMVVLKYEQPSILKYIKDHKLNMEVYYPANTLEIGRAVDELINMGESTKEPKHHHYL